MQLTLEIIRSTQADDPFAFAAGEQEYVLRTALGGAESASLLWNQELLSELAALRRPGRDPALAQRIGLRLRTFLSSTRFAQSEAELIAAVARGERVVVTLRLAAAELFALPWELLSLSGSGLHLGALPGVLLRYAWPDVRSAPPASDPGSLRRDGGRVLVAWSAAAGAVPVREHLSAIAGACASAQLPFDEDRDVLPRVSLRRLAEALAVGEGASDQAPAVLHILCHGAQRGGSFGLAWDAEDGSGQQFVEPTGLQHVLAPHAQTLRLVVLSACDSANSGTLGNQLGSVAQALHRAGIASVVASRYPLSVAGSVLLTETLYATLLLQPASLEAAVLTARARLLRESISLDWAALQLYACPEDGDDTRPLSFRPYRGLSAFSPRHSRFFFGRQAERQQALGALRRLLQGGRPRFLMVTGASGTGKSSVVLAGLLPDLLGTTGRSERDDALARTAADLLRLLPAASSAGHSPLLRSALITLRQELTQIAAAGLGGAWEWAVMRPGAEPLAALDEALASRQDDSRPFLLVVDQLEELFTHGADAAQRGAFGKRLWALAQGGSGVSCVVTLRVDFLGRCGEIAIDGEGQWLDRVAYDDEHRVFIAQPGPDKLAEAIREPAEIVGLHIAPALLQRMVSEVAGEPGALPLLSHLLDVLWQNRRGRALSEEVYAQLGGVAGALEGSADRLYDALSPPDQALARKLLVRLVGISGEAGGETRLRVPLSRLRDELSVDAGEDEERLLAVLSAFVTARLLVWGDGGGQPVIEVAHEALIRRWSRLQDFLRADRERLLEVRELAGWQTQYESFGTLLRGSQLGYAERLWQKYAGELGAPIARLIQHSLRAQRVRVISWLFAIVGIVLSLSSLSLLAVRSAQRAGAQRRIAQQGERTAQARLLSLHAEQLTDSKPDTALLIATRAYELRKESSTRSALLGALQQSAAIQRFLPVPAVFAETASETDETWRQSAKVQTKTGRGVATNSQADETSDETSDETADGTSRQRPAGGLGVAAPGRVHSVAWSRDSGRLLAAAGQAGLLLYDVPAGRLIWARRPLGRSQSAPELYAAALSPDGASAVAAGQGGQIFGFSLREPEAPAIVIDTPARALYSLDYSPDGAQLAAGTGDGQVLIIDMQDRRRLRAAPWSTGSPQIVAAIAYEPGGGQRLAVVGNSGALSVHAAADGALLLGPLPGGHGYLSSVAWDRSGRSVAAASEDGGVLLWDSTTGQRIARESGKATTALSAVSFSPDGQFLATCGLDGQLTLAPPAEGRAEQPPWRAPGGAIYSCAFAPDGQRLASGGDGQILLWDVAAHPAVHRRRQPAPVSALSVAPDGSQAVLGEPDGGLRRWVLSRGQPEAPVAVHRRAINALAHSRDGRLIASGSSDGSVVLLASHGSWETPRLRYSSGHGAVAALALSPDAEVLAVGYADGTLLRIDTERGGLRGAALATAQQAVTALAFSADGRVLWSGGLDGSLLSFATESGGRLCRAAAAASGRAHSDAVNSLVLAPAGDYLASAGRDGRILLWSPGSDGCLRNVGEPPLRHQGGINSLSFSGDGALLASGGDDRSVLLWDVQRQEPLGRPLLVHRRAIAALGFGADRVLLSGDSETIWRWDLDESAWSARACARAGRNLSLAEWQQAFGERPYCRICATAPAGVAAPPQAPLCPP